MLRRFVRGGMLSENFVLYLSIVFFAILYLFMPYIASGRNLANLSSNLWPLLALVLGQMFVLILGGIDLSQTSTMALTSVVGGMLMTTQLEPTLFEKSPLWGILLSPQGSPISGTTLAVPLGILAMLAVGTLVGLLNGLAVAKGHMPAFMVTLVSMMFFSGLAIFLTKSENIMYLPGGFTMLGAGEIGSVPYSFFVVLTLAVVAQVVLKHTVLGRWFFAVGKNLRTSVVSGVPTERVIVLGYVFSGFCAAVASILYSARLACGRPTLGQNLLLDVIGAAVIGGISLFGGKGKVLWAFFGVLFFVLLSNALSMLALPFYAEPVVKGTVILLAALLDVTRTRLLAREVVA
ncbi:MAG TPA: ABC transporter permease [Sedimentisphaerales bacterium]|nr:ABC transporter permease [Sedimentisphaerales bacterium]HQG48051.1 ABC transporter permease [Sedimentisphaerales bacterium]